MRQDLSAIRRLIILLCLGICLESQLYFLPRLSLTQPFINDSEGGDGDGPASWSTVLADADPLRNTVVNTKVPTAHELETNPNKTLVFLTGNLRGGEATWRSMYKHVLDVNMADLALLIGNTIPQYQNSSMFQRAKFIWTVPEYDDWADAMELIPNKPSNWRELVFPKLGHVRSNSNNTAATATNSTTTNSTNTFQTNSSFGILLGGANNIRGSGALVFMYRWFASQKIQQYKLTQHYNRFIISRTDHYYGCPHDISKLHPSTKLWIPRGEDWWGICDRHLVVNNNSVLPAIDLLPPLLRAPEEYRVKLQNAKIHNTELFLKFRWIEQGLWNEKGRFKRPMFVATVPTDPGSRWSEAKFNTSSEFDHVGVKYKMEFKGTKRTCGAYLEHQQKLKQLQHKEKDEMETSNKELPNKTTVKV